MTNVYLEGHVIGGDGHLTQDSHLTYYYYYTLYILHIILYISRPSIWRVTLSEVMAIWLGIGSASSLSECT